MYLFPLIAQLAPVHGYNIISSDCVLGIGVADYILDRRLEDHTETEEVADEPQPNRHLPHKEPVRDRLNRLRYDVDDNDQRLPPRQHTLHVPITVNSHPNVHVYHEYLYM